MTIALETEAGSKLAEALDINVIVRLAEQLPEVSLVQGIDPYGDTVFNRVQISRVIEELRQLQGSAAEAESAVIDSILALAQRCHDEVHVYLKFYGD